MSPILDLPEKGGFVTKALTLQNLLLLFLAALAALAFLVDGASSVFGGLWVIQLHPARLLSDYIEIAGPGAALLNAALVGLTGFLFIKLTGVMFSGPTFAAVLTMTGFGLFGKTPLNILPIIFGVYLAARLMKKTLKDYLIIALFGTALGPLVSTLAWETGLPPLAALTLAVLGGAVTGFLLPPIAVSMLHLHQGYNLYNMGLSCGFFALFAASVIRGLGHEYQSAMDWSADSPLFLILLIPVLSLVYILAGFLLAGKKSWKDLLEIQGFPGRLPSDFADMASVGGALINSGLVGLAGSLYVYFTGSPFNGPVLGGLLTIMGFGAFGTHLRNSWPVLTGVAGTALLTGHSLNEPGPILAALFCTTLGPLAGQFGVFTGIIAGIVHFLLVMQTGSWAGGMNLYNNGFAGGMTAALIVSVIQWYRTNRLEH